MEKDSNRLQIYVLVRNAIAAFLIFLALVQLLTLVHWRAINWEVVAPTVLGLASSFGIWFADRLRGSRERKKAIASQLRTEQDLEIKRWQESNLTLIQGLQESLDSTVITLAGFEEDLARLKATDADMLTRLSELEKDLETHRDRWAHRGAEDALRSQQRELFKLRAQVEGIAGAKEVERRVDTVLESVNQTNAQMERLRRIVGQLPGAVDDRDGEK